MAITLGLVEAVDDNGVYVSMPGSRGVLRGPYRALSTVAVGNTVLLVATDDGEQVVVGTPGGYGTFSVAEFGATGDGVTDDTAAVQSAIDAAEAISGTVSFPPGEYLVSAGLTVSSRVALVGAGREMSKIQASINTFNMLTATCGLRISDLWFDGARSGTTVGSAAVYLNGADVDDIADAVVERCRFTNVQGSALAAKNSTRLTVRECAVSTVNASGVRLNGTNTYTWIRDNQLVDCQQSAPQSGNAAIQSQGSSAISFLWIEGNYIEGPKVGIGLDHDGEGFQFVTNNRIVDCTGEGIAFSAGQTTIAGNIIDDTTAAGILYWCVGGGQSQIVITGNTVRNGSQGVALVWAEDDTYFTDVVIAGNLLDGSDRGIQSYRAGGVSGTVGYDNVTIHGNVLTGSATEPLAFAAATVSAQVPRVFDNAYYSSSDSENAKVTDRQTWRKTVTLEGTTVKYGTDAADAAGTYWVDNATWKDVSSSSYNRHVGSWWGYNSSTPGVKGVGLAAVATGAYGNSVTGSLMASYASTAATKVVSWSMSSGGASQLAFYGTNPIQKPTVTGSRGGNAALQSLLTALSNLGLITDSSS